MSRNRWFFLALTAVLTLIPLSAADRTKTFEVGAGGSLVVNVVGDIQLKTGSSTQVTVDVQGMDDEDLQYLSMTQSGNAVRVEFRPQGGMGGETPRFIIGLPAHFDVDLRTSGGDISLTGNLTGKINGKTAGGDIQIGDVDGTTTLTTAGGDISAGKVGGDAALKTAGGDIRLESSEGLVEVQTAGGDITVGDVAKSLNANTSGGDIHINNVNGDATASTSGGDIQVGKIAGSAKLNTAGGDIVCQGATGEVTANTAGGDMNLSGISGSLQANNAGGDIHADLNPEGTGTSSLTTAGGDLIISVPDAARARIEAVIDISGRWQTNQDEYQIQSDFKAATFEKDEAAKEIRAVYELNGGGALIRLKTSNGNIRIRKAGAAR